MDQDQSRLTEALLALAERALAGVPIDEIEHGAALLRDDPCADDAWCARVDALVQGVRDRHHEVEELRLSEYRLGEAQRVGAMGSYDWHITSDTNSWSDELYRIYGTEPQSFNASYEKFM